LVSPFFSPPPLRFRVFLAYLRVWGRFLGLFDAEE
jgi:hypothetical protein